MYRPERAGDPGSRQGWDPPPSRTGGRRPQSSPKWGDSRSTGHPYRESSDSICTEGCLPASIIFSSRGASRPAVIVPLRLTSAYRIAIRHLSSQVLTLSRYGSRSRQPASRSYLAKEHLALSVRQGLPLFDEHAQRLEATPPSSAAWRTNPRCRTRSPRTPPAATGPPRSRRVSLNSARSRSLPPRVGGGRPPPGSEGAWRGPGLQQSPWSARRDPSAPAIPAAVARRHEVAADRRKGPLPGPLSARRLDAATSTGTTSGVISYAASLPKPPQVTDQPALHREESERTCGSDSPAPASGLAVPGAWIGRRLAWVMTPLMPCRPRFRPLHAPRRADALDRLRESSRAPRSRYLPSDPGRSCGSTRYARPPDLP